MILDLSKLTSPPQAGVVGYMTWWNVNLDGVALINLIMCIGFSVDFSAHICYHYMSEDDKTPDERIRFALLMLLFIVLFQHLILLRFIHWFLIIPFLRASLYALGMPIVQGAVSTILGVFGLAFAPSYLYVTFFKMVFLVIFLGAAHGLILLPVLLSLFGPGSCSDSKSNKSAISTPSTTVSVHSTKLQSCYTVSLGLGGSKPVDHFQRRPETANFDRFFVTRMADEQLVAGLPPPRAAEPRLAPVLEGEEGEVARSRGVRVEGHRSLGAAVEHRKICRSKSHRPRTLTEPGNKQVNIYILPSVSGLVIGWKHQSNILLP